MRYNLKLLISACIIIFSVINFDLKSSICIAQDMDTTLVQNDYQINALRVFIDCEDCDLDYIRNNIKFVNFVREPKQSDVHILISEQETASEGRQLSLRFIGRQNYTGWDQNLVHTSPQSDTEDKLRRGLTKVIKMGLMPYISQTSMAQLIDFEYDEQKADLVRKKETDPWMYWIFHIDLQGELEAEESQNDINIITAMSAERTTELWKIESDFKYEYLQENFEDDDESITSKREEWEADVAIIKSLNSHWSAGLFGSGNSSTHKNLDLSLGIAAGIEYNFFPWNQSDRKIFSMSYSAGMRSYDYREETLYEKTSEQQSFGRMRFELRMIQPWGEIDASLENSHYFFDLSKNRFTLESELSIRITEGLSFKLDLEAESIHDQLYLPRGDATLEEILLEQKQRATTYDISVQFGLRYSFGSIYNNIVNRRF